MANPEHLEILKQGVEVWNIWRDKNPNVRPDHEGVSYPIKGYRGRRRNREHFLIKEYHL